MRIGIVGTGVMGANHIRVLRSLPQFAITCAMDSNRQNLEKTCRDGGMLLYDDYRVMVDQVDAVLVATPTEWHHPIGSFFLRHGKHVMVEKPITQTPDQAEELIRLAEQNGLVLAVGHLERFNPAVEYVNRIIDRPRFIEVQRLGSFSPRSLDIDVILDLMIHDLDIILQWDNSGLKELRAVGVPVISKRIDIANVRLEFNSGLVATITASRVSQEKTRKLRIFQKDQYISVDYTTRAVKVFRLQGREISQHFPQIPDVEPLRQLWANFHRTISEGRNFNVTGRDGLAALDLAIRISSSMSGAIES